MKPKKVALPKQPEAHSPARRKRGSYKKTTPALKKQLVLRLDRVSYVFIENVVGLLGVKDRSAFARLALARALHDLPDLIVRIADEIAQKHIRREVASELGCAETVLDWGLPKAQAALEKLEWSPESDRKLDDVVEVISLKREGKRIRNVGFLSKTSYAHSLSPQEHTKLIEYLCASDPSAERPRLRAELDVVMARLIGESFARRKLGLLKIRQLRAAAIAQGIKPTEIPDYWNDPEALEWWIWAESPEQEKAALDLAREVREQQIAPGVGQTSGVPV